MDGQGSTSTSNGNSQRRKLIKKPPSHHYTRSSSGFDAGGPDVPSLQLQLENNPSSQSLRRAPSAPQARSNPATASNASSPRHPPTSANNLRSNPSNPSPILPQGDFASSNVAANPYGAVPYRPSRLSDPHSRPLSLTKRTSDDFIGAPFDGAAILNRIESTKISSPQPAQNRFNYPPPLVKTSTDLRLAPPRLRTSASFTAMDSSLSEKAPGPRGPEGLNPKRYSDEGREVRSAVLRKKSGFSGFMNSLVGSPKKPLISAPENPVHVTHVGYDSSTGQFTVSLQSCIVPSISQPS